MALASVCANLAECGVKVKPDEAISPKRAVVLRVLGDFAISSMSVNVDAMHQPVACNIENSTSSSVASSFNINRLIVCHEALKVLSKGSTQFTLADVVKPEAKRFSQMLQVMLKYFFHVEGVFEMVSQISPSFDDAAARVQGARDELEFVRSKLHATQNRVRSLCEAQISQTLSDALSRKDVIMKETAEAPEKYNQVKQSIERASNELAEKQKELNRQKSRLENLRSMIVHDPQNYINQKNQLEKDVSLVKGSLSLKKNEAQECSQKLYCCEETLERAKDMLSKAKQTAVVREEFASAIKATESRIFGLKQDLQVLEVSCEAVKASIDSYSLQLHAIELEENKMATLLRDQEEKLLHARKALAETEGNLKSLETDLARTTAIIGDTVKAAETAFNAWTKIAEVDHAKLRSRWEEHVRICADFTAACVRTDDRLKNHAARFNQIVCAVNSFLDEANSNLAGDDNGATT